MNFHNTPDRKSETTAMNNLKNTDSSPAKSFSALAPRHYHREQKDIIEILSGCLICVSPEGMISYLSPMFVKVSGWPKGEWIDKPVRELIYANDQENFQKAFQETLQNSTVTKLEMRVKSKDGNLVDFFASIVPNGKKDILIIGWDVTNQKEAERQGILRLEQIKWESQLKTFRMLDDIPDGVFAIDRDWHLLYLNKEAERIARKKSDEIIGKHLWKTYPELIGTTIYEKYTEAMNTGKSSRFEEFLPEFDAWFETNLYPSPEGLAVYFRETTERKRSQEQLKHYAEELERSNADLEQFAYAASHDLQEPLRMISSYVSLLAEDAGDQLSEESKKYIQFAQEGADRMRTLIRDLLEYSRLCSAGLIYQKLDSHQIVDFALLNLKQRIEELKAEIVIGKLPTVEGARSQLVLLFQTLISNALKFNGGRNPRISIEANTTTEGVVFCIRDNGIGIPPQHLESIFKIFKRLHSRSAYPGTGIGLAIAKKIVERYGGKIWATSKFGQGSSFHFLIPHHRPNNEMVSKPQILKEVETA